MVLEGIEVDGGQVILKHSISDRESHPEKVEEDEPISEAEPSLYNQVMQTPLNTKDLEEVIKTLPLEVVRIIPDRVVHLCINLDL